jgi:hypothetical protein
MKSIIAIWMLLLTAFSAEALSFALYTDFDREIVQYPGSPELAVMHYLKNHGITEEEMIGHIESNIAEHLATAEEEPGRFTAAANSLMPLQWMKTPKALERLEAYTDETNPVQLRANAVSRFLFSSQLSGLNVASNVMTQTWRSSNEHGAVQRVYYSLAKKAQLEEREAYVEFFMWASTNAHLGGLIKTWDQNIIEFDATWRTNPLRRASAEFQMQYALKNEIATNNVLSVSRDYELATGLRHPELPLNPPSPVVAVAPDISPATNAVSASASFAVPPEGSFSPPTSRSRRGVIVLGVVLFVLLVIVVWHWRHSGRRP